ncbi:RHS repeat-associated core domain-containing protein [Amycolatopsis sulphurea]|uniref:RHS repeat-associated core domain-containing protein n=1 Tax=Amycolatopsis sulphurea TaxID=76022 RepID=UPI000BF519B9|nr:RHS repeat-associated core domain-containing protein [Amycolatopsis sulphurea]
MSYQAREITRNDSPYYRKIFNTAAELSGSTVTATTLTGGLDQVFARTAGGGTQSLLTDRLGSTVAVSDGNGAVTGEYTYQPFGGTTLTGTDGANPTRFAGREDEGGGLYYNRARYYSTGEQRFLSRDPLGFGGGDSNLYAYVTNRPTDLVDPLGTKPRDQSLSGAGRSSMGGWDPTDGFDAGPADNYTAAGHGVRYGAGKTAVGSDRATMNNFANVRNIGMHDVFGHGTRNGFSRFDGETTNAGQFVDAIRANPSYQSGQSCRLIVCHSGVSGVGQQVSDELGVPVLAPNGRVGISKVSEAGVEPQVQYNAGWTWIFPKG